MAIAYDTSSDGGALTGTSPKTWSHTCTGSNRILFVCAWQQAISEGITGVTYNGVAMTKIAYQANTNSESIALYYLVNPASGSNTVSISFTGASVTGSATSYTGASQTGQPDSFAKKNQTTATVTLATTVVASNCWLVGAFVGAGLGASAGTGTTLRVKANNNAVWNQGALTDSNGTVGTGSQSQQGVDSFANDPWAVIVASFSEATATVAQPSIESDIILFN